MPAINTSVSNLQPKFRSSGSFNKNVNLINQKLKNRLKAKHQIIANIGRNDDLVVPEESLNVDFSLLKSDGFSTDPKRYKKMAYKVLKETNTVKNSSELQGRLDEICSQEYQNEK